MKFRKKTVIIDAIQFTGTKENYAELAKFCPNIGFLPADTLLIKTLEGNRLANVGDWIIRGILGEFYPCKPDIFAQTYELLEGTSLVCEPESVLALCRDILEFAENGDYSNGNEAFGTDEGIVLAGEALGQYRKKLEEFEKETTK